MKPEEIQKLIEETEKSMPEVGSDRADETMFYLKQQSKLIDLKGKYMRAVYAQEVGKQLEK